MKKYVTTTRDTCWTDCLGCMLEINPKRIPKFVKEFGNKYMDVTRVWLRDNFKKGLVYIPSRAFMETGAIRQNGPLGPEGYSIAHLSMVDDSSMHVAIAYNGGIIYDNGDDRSAEYGTIQGYFVIYDLEPSKAKLVLKKKRRGRKRGTSKKP